MVSGIWYRYSSPLRLAMTSDLSTRLPSTSSVSPPNGAVTASTAASGVVREGTELPEHRLLVRVEQVVAPADDGLSRRCRRGCIATAAADQVEADVEALGELVERDGAQAGGRQLDCQPEPVEAPADLLDDRNVRGTEDEPRSGGEGSVDERLGRRSRPSPLSQGGDETARAASATEQLRLVASTRTMWQRSSTAVTSAYGVHEMLAVVEHEEGLAFSSTT